MTINIKTLAEILAESDSDSARTAAPTHQAPARHQASESKTNKEASDKNKTAAHLKDTPPHPSKNNPHKTYKSSFRKNNTSKNNTSKKSTRKNSKHKNSKQAFEQTADANTDISTNSTAHKRKAKQQKRFHPAATFILNTSEAPAYHEPEPQSIKAMLAEVKSAHESTDLDAADTDNLPAALKAYLRTPEQKQAEIDAIKAESRLRWLAFYYLSRREYGRAELKQKLLDKEQDPEQIEALLDEFADKGYQSDYRATLMLIRENIRKGRGRERIKQAFYQKKMVMPSNIDELIDMAQSESEAFSEFISEDDDLVEGVDWVKLAVEARVKKYGNHLPSDQKDKARQLRFLQYRGFESEVCFTALEYTLDTLDERF